MPFVIDSNVLIDVSRGNAAAIRYVDGLNEPWVLSQVTALELIVGARDKRDHAVIDGLLSLYSVVPLTDGTGKKAYELLKAYVIQSHTHPSAVAAYLIDPIRSDLA
jgi:predicted nucleic acid-binding protein